MSVTEGFPITSLTTLHTNCIFPFKRHITSLADIENGLVNIVRERRGWDIYTLQCIK